MPAMLAPGFDLRDHVSIIPIAGGKGGIGKSIIAANVAIGLARMGHSVVAIDLDLGGSNLHSYLGLPNTLPSIGDYVKQKSKGLNEFLHPTWQENLRFLPGDGRTPFLANIPFSHKIKLIRSIKSIDADFVLVDLGAGSAFNTLDFFGMSASGILVAIPEQPALMGMMVFMKNMLFRLIERNLRENREVCQLLHDIFSQPITAEKITVDELQRQVTQVHAESGSMVQEICRHYRPRVILNCAGSADDLVNRLEPAARAIKKMLSVDIDHFGFIFADPNVSKAVDEGKPLIDYDPEGLAVFGLNVIAERISRVWDTRLEESDKKLLLHTRDAYSLT